MCQRLEYIQAKEKRFLLSMDCFSLKVTQVPLSFMASDRWSARVPYNSRVLTGGEVAPSNFTCENWDINLRPDNELFPCGVVSRDKVLVY